MATYPNEALGRAVRALRERKGLTQDALGSDAGYNKGAGVAISRIEGGLLRPGAEKFAGLARALGVTPEELETHALEESTAETASTPTGETASPRPAPRTAKDLRDQAKRIQDEIDDRTATIKSLGDAFNKQHDRARDEFFMRFVEIAELVEGAPQPDPTQLQDDEDDTNPDAVAAFRLKSNATGVGQILAGSAGGAAAGAAVGGAAAYGTFVATATFGAASTGAAISGLSGVAATNATLALLGGGTLAAGGAGVAGGTMLLAGIVAAPAAVLFAGGFLLMRKRNRKQQEELAAQIADANAQLAATAAGYLALQDILPRATNSLDYIATHASHALDRWATEFGSTPRAWDSLTPADAQRYQDFVDIAAAQLTIVTINVQGVLTTDGSDRDELIRLSDEVLTQSQATVAALV